MKAWYFVLVAILIILVYLVCIAVGGWIVQLLWNWLMPYLFQLPTITYWQALGISFLCGLFFEGGRYSSSQK